MTYDLCMRLARSVEEGTGCPDALLDAAEELGYPWLDTAPTEKDYIGKLGGTIILNIKDRHSLREHMGVEACRSGIYCTGIELLKAWLREKEEEKR